MIHIYRTTNNDTETLTFDYAFLPYEIHIQGIGKETTKAEFRQKKMSGGSHTKLSFNLPVEINYNHLVGWCLSALVIPTHEQQYTIIDVQ